jgi:hypothetical protein
MHLRGDVVTQATGCGTCKHWKVERDDFRQLVRFGDPVSDDEYVRQEAAANEADRLYGECRAVTDEGATLDHLPIAMTRDGSGYWSALFTRAEFGCVLHEPTP